MSSQKTTSFNFEVSLNKLTELVKKLEQGNLSLEESLQNFEKGISLVHACQKALSEAEQKVKTLIHRDNKETLVPFQVETETD